MWDPSRWSNRMITCKHEQQEEHPKTHKTNKKGQRIKNLARKGEGGVPLPGWVFEPQTQTDKFASCCNAWMTRPGQRQTDRQYVCLPACVSAVLSIYLSVSIYLSPCRSVCLYLSLSPMSVYLSICSSVCLYLSPDVFIYMYMYT